MKAQDNRLSATPFGDKRPEARDCVFIVVILAVVLLQVLRIGNLPGLYLDAINPDYIAVQMVYPSNYPVHWMTVWPWLWLPYAGNITALLSWITVLITGTTSVLQHHILYGVVLSVAISLVYFYLKRYNAPLAFLTALLLATAPSAISLFCTQYYVELFGTVCALIALFQFRRWWEEGRPVALQWAYFLLGVAFYSYFCYLFFLPTLILATLLKNRENKLLQLLWCLGFFALGCSFYFIGFSKLWVEHAFLSHTGLILLLIGCAFYAYLFTLIRTTNKRAVVAVLVIGLALLVAWVFVCFPYIRQSAEGLDIAKGAQEGLVQRFEHIWEFVSDLFSGRAGEIVIYETTVTRYTDLFIILLGVAILLSVVLAIARKDMRGLLLEVCALLVYCLCSLALAPRMQSQHFVPLIFLSGIIIGKSCIYLCKALSPRVGVGVAVVFAAI